MAATAAPDARGGGDLFRIRRVFSLGDADSDQQHPSPQTGPRLRIVAMAVHSLEKKQLLALSVTEDVAKVPVAPTSAPAAAPSIALGQLPSVEPRRSRVPPGGSSASSSSSSSAAAAASNHLLVRTVEEDEQPRLWRLPVYSNSKQQRAGAREKLVALEFSPEGDWLAALSSRKNRLHLIPVRALIARQRTQLLGAALAPLDPAPRARELMSVHPSVMTAQMASYLRATNEAGGLNGARYHSQVAGDDEQMSTLEFAVGIGAVTCCRWWRSLNGKNYCLVGGSESLVSIVNVEENAEECRCELQHAGAIVAIDLFRENFRKETRTTMLVKALGDDGVVRYYRVVLEKKFLQQQQKQRPSPPANKHQSSLKSLLTPTAKDAPAKDDSTAAAADASAGAASTTIASSFVSSSGTPTFTTSQSFAGQSSFAARAPLQYVVKTFPQHFLEDMDFRPQRIKKNSPQICLYAINGVLSSESSLAMYDPDARRASLYSNFQWSLRNEYIVPSLSPSANEKRLSQAQEDENAGESIDRKSDSISEEEDKVVDVEVAYCTTDLLLLQGRTAKSNRNVSTWISLPSHSGPDDDDQVANAHIVHYLSLHGNEKIERVVQSTARTLQLAGGGGGNAQKSGGGGSALAASRRFSGSSDRLGEAQVIYLLQTPHHVYECRPQWSRLALFKTLCAQSIALRNALSIGYALGIDMASLCQVVAETLCESVHAGKAVADDRMVQWIRELFQVSRALPSLAIDQLRSIGGAQHAIDFAQEILTAKEQQQQQSTLGAPALYVDAYERKQVALKLLDLVLREQLRANVSSSVEGSADGNDTCEQQQKLRPRDATASARLEEKEKWLLHFLETSSDYDTEEIVDQCLVHQQVDKAVLVGRCRQQVRLVLRKIIRAGLAPFVSLNALRSLVSAGFAPELTRPESRLILRAFPIDTQVEVLLTHPPSILQQRDWVVRNLPSISRERCQQIAQCVDPRNSLAEEETDASELEVIDAKNIELADVAASEMMRVLPEERVELFLTILLFLNHPSARDRRSRSSGGSEDARSVLFDRGADDDDKYSQAALERLMKELAQQYRPPVVVARCVDYDNWTAAACVYEAHGELVEAVEARLQAHKVLRPVLSTPPTSPTSALSSSPPLSFSALRRRRQSSDASLESNTGSVASGLSDESEFQDAMREELFQLLDSLVVQRHSERAITEEMKAAILARLIVKWFEYGLAKTELEVFLIDPKVYPFVASLLAKIFFSEVVDGILGGGGSADPRDRLRAAAATPSSSAMSTASTTFAAVARSGFDDRDREWVRMCHRLPFSGQFLFHVCATFLDSGEEETKVHGGGGDSSNESASESRAPPSLERRSAMLKLLDLVKENVLKNDLALPAVTIEPHSAQALGKSDPLETHVKVFTCGHVFPKRVFDEEIVPEFEKRLGALPLPLVTTKQVLLREFKGDAVEAPCPICSFNKISEIVQQQKQLERMSVTRHSSGHHHRSSGHAASTTATVTSRSHSQTTITKAPAQRQPAYYFLHAQGKQPQQSQHGLYQHPSHTQHHHWRHEPWEWRASP